MAPSLLTGNGWIKEDGKLHVKHAANQEESGYWCRSDHSGSKSNGLSLGRSTNCKSLDEETIVLKSSIVEAVFRECRANEKRDDEEDLSDGDFHMDVDGCDII